MTTENSAFISGLDTYGEKSDERLEEEKEASDDESGHITDPFNPNDIKIRTSSLLVAQLVNRIEDDGLDLDPDFQRMRVWDNRRKSRLIESLLLRIPIPVFYVAANEEDDWQVVDGLQRMSTINDYVTGKFSLSGLEFLHDFNGLKHGQLPRPMQRRISETQLSVNIIEPGTPPKVMFNVFARINTGGLPLNRQELRNALNPGPVRGLLNELSKSQEFLNATTRSISSRRMSDKECVLRFIAFYINDPEDYDTQDLDAFLGNVMASVNKMGNTKRDRLVSDFKKSMQAASDIFGDYAFRKWSTEGGRRAPINRALFETWSVHLAQCSPDQIKALVKRRKEVHNKFRKLCRNDDFINSISLTTSAPSRVKMRFRTIRQLVEEFI